MDYDEVVEKFSADVNLYSKVYVKIASRDRQGAIDFVKSVSGCDDEIANRVIDSWSKNVIIPTTEQVAYVNGYEAKRQTAVKCPYCHSSETTKISKSSKVFNTAMFGLFGTKRLKEWHCNSCGSDF